MVELIEKATQELKPDTAQFKVLAFLAFRGACLPGAISEDTGIAPGTVRPALRSLLDKGYVRQQEDGTYRSAIPFTDFVSYVFSKK
ncbi:MAG: winged helix-turn-helix domain-containing protein [Candidatus Bathyarchaeota archaeon]|nr:winged helix-turn-helix domain-containing protein [Candidatus Bathyarchaeota archaeon]